VRNAAWVEIFQRLEGVLEVAAMECSYFAEWLERDAWSALPQSMALAAGIVDEASYGIETVKKIRDRAADWARVVGEERLWISPSCGFGRHPACSRPVPRGAARPVPDRPALVVPWSAHTPWCRGWA
jgi:methionine synthase II (cobalamin-independent)